MSVSTIIEKFPENTFALNQLAVHYISLNRHDEARTSAALLPDTERWRAFKLSIEYRIAVACADISEVSLILQRIPQECEICPSLPSLNLVLRELPEDKAKDISERLAKKWPNLVFEVKTRRLSVSTKKPEHNQIEQAMTLAFNGKVSEAKRLLNEPNVNIKTASALAPMFERLPPEKTLRRIAIVDRGDDVVLSPKGETGTTLLVFTGLADKAMIPIELIDRFCAAEGHSAIYLRDAGRSAYISGIPALAQDFEGTLAALVTLLERYETQKLLCLGTSIGGFAAIRYGIRLEADKIMGASAPTNITSEFISSIGDNRGQLTARRLQRSFSAGELDVKPEVVAQNGRCKIDLWYGDDYPIDVNHASYLSDCAGVNNFPIPGLDTHSSMPSIINSGGFQEFLKP